MNFLVLFIKGLIIGAGKIIPGISGSVLAISLNVYDKAIFSIESMFRNYKKSISYLLPLALGILFSILLLSNTIIILIRYNYSVTISLIMGLILGSVPNSINKIRVNIKRILYILTTLLFLFFIYRIRININLNIFACFILGIVEAFTSIMPGISSTALYLNLNIYNSYLSIISNIASINFIFFLFGAILGVFYTSKIMFFLLKKYEHETKIFIQVLILSSVLALVKYISFNILNTALIIIGFVISYRLNK